MIRLLLKYFPHKNSTAYCYYYNQIAVLLPYFYSWKLVPVGKLHALNDSRVCFVSLLLLFIPAFVIFMCIIGAPFKVQFLESETAGSPRQIRGTSWWGVKEDCCEWWETERGKRKPWSSFCFSHLHIPVPSLPGEYGSNMGWMLG